MYDDSTVHSLKHTINILLTDRLKFWTKHLNVPKLLPLAAQSSFFVSEITPVPTSSSFSLTRAFSAASFVFDR